MIVGVVGCGNVGYNTLRAFKQHRFGVRGYDIDTAAVNRVNQGIGPHVASDQIETLDECDVVFICVPTDPTESGKANLDIYNEVVKIMAAREVAVSVNWKAVVQRSTCPPGTALKMSAKFSRSGYIVNPSFLRKATAWEDTIRPERIAIGGQPEVRKALEHLYANFPGSRYLADDFRPVELLKYMENAIDAVLISLSNEFLSIADKVGMSRLDFIEMLGAISDRPKFATTVRVGGQAFGMWCLPKDLAAIAAEFPEITQTMQAALRTNLVVSSEFGENKIPGTSLYNLENGKIVLSDLGRNYLEEVRTGTSTEA